MVDSTEDAVPDPEGDTNDGEADPKPGLSRRRFMGRGSLGVAAAGVIGSVPGLGSWLASTAPETSAAAGDTNAAASDASGAEQAIVAQVHDVSTGDISLHINGATFPLRDPELARTIARALP